MTERRYPATENERTEGQPLRPARLAAIWRGLPEKERLSVILSLRVTVALKKA